MGPIMLIHFPLHLSRLIIYQDTSKDKDWVKSLNAHTAASSGDLDALIALAKKNPESVKHRDNNGWTPLHEAVRGGHVDVAKFLLKSGLDKVRMNTQISI